MLKHLRANLKRAKNSKRHTPSRRKMQFEALEPRILLSADLGIEALQHDPLPDPLGAHKAELHDSQFVENQVQAGDTPPGIGLSIPDAEIGEKQLIIVDSTLPDYDTLVEEIQAQKDSSTSYEVRLLDGDGNSFEQISTIVAEQTDLSAIHILSHGSDGQLILGSRSLNTGNLQEHSDTLAQWGSALNEDGDILLYGCHIAAGDVGIEFIESIATLTGADVAASDDATGAADLGGDWQLEAQVGDIESKSVDVVGYQHRLAADLSTPGVQDALKTGVDSFEARFLEFMDQDAFLGKELPLLIEVTGGEEKISTALSMYDLLGDVADLFDQIDTALDENSFSEFSGALHPDVFPVVTDNSDDSALRYSLQIAYTISGDHTLDLGTEADALGVTFAENLAIPVTSTLNMTLEIGVRSSDEAAADSDFFWSLSDASVTVSAARDSFPSSEMNVGFIGTNVNSGNAELSATVEMDLLADPTSPSIIGITDSEMEDPDGILGAGQIPDSFDLAHDVSFFLRVANGNTIEVELAAGDYGDLDGLISGLQTAVDNAGFAGQVIVQDNAGRIELVVNAKLGFNNDNSDSTGGTLTADNLSPLIGTTASTDVGFYLIVGDSPEQLVTVTTTADADNPVTLESLVADVNIALGAAGITDIEAVAAGGVLQLQLTASAPPGTTFSIHRRLNLWSDRSQSDLERFVPNQLFSSSVTDSAYLVDLDVSVAPGLTADGPNWAPANQSVSLDNSTALFDLPTPAVDIYDNTRFGLDVTLSDALQPFSYLSPSDIVNQLRNFGSWLDRLRASDYFSADKIPFADATFGDIFDFQDMLEDMLLTDDMDNADETDDDYKLIGKVVMENGNTTRYPNHVNFSNVQEFATKLAESVPGGNVRYDETGKTLLFDLDLTHVFQSSDVAADFSFDLLPLQDFRSDSQVRLTGSTAMTVNLGIDLNEGAKLDGSTPLSDLNYGNGVDIKNVASVMTDEVPFEYGRLSSDANFTLVIDGSEYAVSLSTSATDGNQTIADLVADINDAFASAINESGDTEDISDRVSARVNAENALRIDIYAVDSGTSFTLQADSEDTAVTEIGFANEMTPKDQLVSMGTEDATSGPFAEDEVFSVTIGAETITITLKQEATEGNASVEDLVKDINTAVKAATESRIAARVSADNPQRIEFYALDQAVESLSVDAGSNLGFSGATDSVAREALTTETDIPLSTSDVAFSITVDGDVYDVALEAGDTYTNKNILDLVNDVRAALEESDLPENTISVGNQGNHLVFSAVNAGTSFTITPGTNADQIGITQEFESNTSDFVVHLSDGTATEVSLDDLTGDSTVDDLLTLLNAVTGLDAQISQDDTYIQLQDETFDSGSGDFFIEALNGSKAIIQLGLYRSDLKRADDTADGKIEGGTIFGTRLADRFYVANGSSVGGDFELDAADVSATAEYGFVGVGLSGGGQIAGSLTSNFLTPATGNLTFSQLFDNLGTLETVIDGPAEQLNQDHLTFSVDIDPDVAFIAEPISDVVMTTNGLRDTTVTLTDLPASEELTRFKNLTATDIVNALDQVAAFVADFESSGDLAEPLALINESVQDLLGLSEKFELAADAFRDNPAANLQSVNTRLQETLGVGADAVTLSLDGDRLKISLQLTQTVSDSINLDIDLGEEEIRLTGPAGLKAQGALNLNLDFAIDLDTPADVYLYESTEISGTLTVAGEGLNFWASLEPFEGNNLSISVQGGSAELNVTDFGAFLNLGASALIDDVDANDIDTIAEGTVSAALPAFAPTQSDFAGDIALLGGVSPIDLTDNTLLSLGGADEILDAVDPAEQSPYNNLLMAIEGLDLFFGGLQDLLDGEVFGINIPLLGDQFSEGARFIEDLRDDFIDPFRDKVEEVVDPNADLLSNLLFQLLGAEEFNAGALFPGVALDLLLTTNDDGDVVRAESAEDIELEIGDDGEFIQWNLKIGKASERLLGTDIDLDLGIPGLGIDIDGDVGLDLGWNLDLKFGVSKEDGFYLDISDPSDLKVDLDVELPTNITGKLGFLQLEAVDHFVDEDGDGQDDEIDSGLGASFAIDLVSRMALKADSGGPFEMTKITADSGLGFSLSEKAQKAVVAEADAPKDGRLQQNVGFDLRIDGVTTSISLLQSATEDNQSIDDLVADLNQSLEQAGLQDTIKAGRDGKRLTLKSLPLIKSFQLENSGSQELFGDSLDSGEKSYLLLNKKTPEKGVLESDLQFRIIVTEGRNAGQEYTVSLEAEKTEENDSFSDLVKQLNDALKTAGATGISFSSGDPRLSLGELSTLGVNFGLAAEATANLDLTLKVSEDLNIGDAGVLPEIKSNFVFEWGFGERSEGDDEEYVDFSADELKDAVGDGLQLVTFNDVSLDLGSFISDFAEPILGEIRSITEPVQPVVDILTMEIPVISDLSGSSVTLLDIADLFGKINVDFIRGVATVIDLINDIPLGAESIMINFGDLTIYEQGDDIDLTDKNTDLNKVDRPAGNDFDEELDKQSDGSTKSFTKKINKSEGFAFPILNDPQQIFNLLLGQEATLMTYDLPDLSLDFNYSQYFPIYGPLGASITGSFSADIDFHEIGYDTLGIMQFADSGFRNPELIFEGFFISDLDDNGNDVDEVMLSGGLSAAAELNLGIARAGVGGGIFANIYFDLFDPNQDGKIRINEVLSTIDSQLRFGNALLAPLSPFNVSGEVFARLFAFLEIDLFFFEFSEEWNITPPITLVDFEIPFTRPPQLATELAGGVLQLNMGDFAEQRLYGDISDGDESFTVTGNSSALTVTMNRGQGQPYSQTYIGNFNKIIASAGEGNDTVNLAGVGSGVAAEITGGAGNDTLIAGAGVALIRGGEGDDTITGGSNSDQLFGDTGDDNIDGGAGNDIIIGDVARIGDNYIRARASLVDGDDILKGDDGEDIIIGGGGMDTINGGAGSDVIIGDSGRISFSSTTLSVATISEISDTDRGLVYANDVLSGDGGDDAIYGGRGDDTLSGGLGDDTLYGEVGDDTLLAASGSDTVYAGAGNDLVFADRDRLAVAGGTPGGATIYGQEGDDVIIGSSAADDIDGGRGQDIVFAGGGPDTIRGGQGNDLLNGEAGEDDYRLTYTGGIISSTTSVYDTGDEAENDILRVSGSEEADTFLLRASYVEDQSLLGIQDKLTSLTGLPGDLSLSLALPANLPTRAFVAKLNGEENAQRANYYYIENVIVNGLEGDDQFAVDDTSAVVQINGGDGDDQFQIGQLYNSLRDAEAGVDPYDLFTTVQSTRGFLSNGISESMLINGEAGNDKFVVFRNLGVLTLKGGTGDDEFIVKAFALEGSVDDPDRDRTEISGEEGADRIEYAINAPVDIDGGDGFDTVKVIGTEFGDDFVVTDAGIYGGGLNINFINVEKVTLDAAEGNDRIYVRSTGDGQITEIFAGEGSDTFSIGGDSPPIVSRDLLGHSGVVTHSSTSADSDYDGLVIDGISANVADNDEAGIVVSALDLVRTWEAGQFGRYAIVLTKRPENDVTINLIQQQPTPNEDAAGIAYYELQDGFGEALSSLTFTAEDWDQPREVRIHAFDDAAVEGLHYAVINHKVISDDAGYDGLAIPTVTVELVDNDHLELLITETDGATQVIEGDGSLDAFPFVDTYQISLTALPQNGETVTVRLTDPTGQLRFDQAELIFTSEDEYSVQSVSVTAAADGLREGIHTSYIHHSLQVGSQEEVAGPLVRVDIGDSDIPGVMVLESDGATNVIENDLGKDAAPFVDSYRIVLTAQPDADVTISVDPQETKTSAQIFNPETGRYETHDRFAEQVVVDQQRLVFTTDNWWQPQQISVTALDDDVIDGGDTKVFAPVANTIAGIQGPLFIDGAGGEGSGAGLGGEPFMLPTENNEVGDVVEATSDTLVAKRGDVDKLGDTYFQDLSLVKVIISSGTGAGQERYLLDRVLDAGQENYRFDIDQPWDIVPDETSRYYFERELLSVDESQQVDVATVYNQDSPADNTGHRMGTLSAENLSGLGLGPDLQIGESTFAGGMSYVNLENLTINLGSGDDHLHVTGIQHREDFQTVTVVNTGAGDDYVHFNGPQTGESGLFALHLEQGDDRVTAENTTADLIIFGDDGADTIQSGDGNDIVFADFGRVDYLNDAGEVVTRFGLGQRGVVKDTVIPATDLQSVPFAQTDGAFYGPTVAVSRVFESGWNDELRGGGGNDLLIGGAGSDTVYGDGGDDILIGDNGVADYAAGRLVEVSSGDPNIGDSDEMHGGAGHDLIIGGAAADTLDGGAGNDAMVGDAGGGTYVDGVLRRFETLDRDRFIGGDDQFMGGSGNDYMLGGHGDDTFFGNFSEDLMIGEYARVTLSEGRVESVVRLGQGRLDLIANRQFGLYAGGYRAALLADVGTSMQPLNGLSAESIVDGDLSGFAKRLPHHDGYQRDKREIIDDPEHFSEVYTVEEGDTLWSIAKDKLGDPLLWRVIFEANPGISDPDLLIPNQEIIIPAAGAQSEAQPDRSGQDSNQTDAGLGIAVAGVMGWGVASTHKLKYGNEKQLYLNRMKQQERSWRWEQGRLKKETDFSGLSWDKPFMKKPGFSVEADAAKSN